MDLVGLTYVSIRRHKPETDPLEELRRIHQQSARNNPKRGISGVLLCTKNHYIQFIEGPEKTALDLFDTIQKDKAHYNVKLRRSSTLDERQFPDWSMNVVYIQSINQALYGYEDPTSDLNPYHLTSDVLFGLLSAGSKQTLCSQLRVA
jgi:hypothetical protein